MLTNGQILQHISGAGCLPPMATGQPIQRLEVRLGKHLWLKTSATDKSRWVEITLEKGGYKRNKTQLEVINHF
jgi:hypothetical protein